jgi:hypothetical protein
MRRVSCFWCVLILFGLSSAVADDLLSIYVCIQPSAVYVIVLSPVEWDSCWSCWFCVYLVLILLVMCQTVDPVLILCWSCVDPVLSPAVCWRPFCLFACKFSHLLRLCLCWAQLTTTGVRFVAVLSLNRSLGFLPLTLKRETRRDLERIWVWFSKTSVPALWSSPQTFLKNVIAFRDPGYIYPDSARARGTQPRQCTQRGGLAWTGDKVHLQVTPRLEIPRGW